MNKKFENKIAVVTGGCRGIGKSISIKLAGEGCFVYALDYVVPDSTEPFHEDPEIAGRIVCAQADVTSMESIEKNFAAIIESKGKIDFLVNNAGITRDNLLMRMNEQEWDSVLTTNLKGAFICTKAVIRSMMSQRFGRIVNIGSIVGTMGNAGQANYSASKAGLIGFSKSTAKELASRNILVNVIAPGYVRTPMTDKLTDEQRKAFLDHIPLKRVAEPEEIAAAVSFLVSDDAAYITGQVLHINGGLYM